MIHPWALPSLMSWALLTARFNAARPAIRKFSSARAPACAKPCWTARRSCCPAEYFMQAEEYDLSFRILAAGFSIRRFADMPLRHLKTPGARQAVRTTQFGLKCEIMLYLLAKYVPAPLCFSLGGRLAGARYWMMAKGRDDHRPGHEHQRAIYGWRRQGSHPQLVGRNVKRGRRLPAPRWKPSLKFQVKSRIAAWPTHNAAITCSASFWLILGKICSPIIRRPTPWESRSWPYVTINWAGQLSTAGVNGAASGGSVGLPRLPIRRSMPG